MNKAQLQSIIERIEYNTRLYKYTFNSGMTNHDKVTNYFRILTNLDDIDFETSVICQWDENKELLTYNQQASDLHWYIRKNILEMVN
jgi:hypothetical protein